MLYGVYMQVNKVNQFIFVGVGCQPDKLPEENPLPCNGSGFTSNGDLYQAVLESKDVTQNRFATRRVQRLKFGDDSDLSFSFEIGGVSGCSLYFLVLVLHFVCLQCR